MRSFLRILSKIAVAAALLVASLWSAGVLAFSGPFTGTAATAASSAAALLGLLACAGLFVRRLRPATHAMVAVLALVGLWWSSITPSNDRTWAPEVSALPWAEIEGNRVTVHNIRNFDYRTETDFTPRWYDRTFDLDELDSLDVVASYWMGDDIAHLLVSFGFAGRDYLSVSIETRKEQSESYSTLAGFFRQYELFYVVADERDLIRLRTNYRKDPPEDVYLYRSAAPPENIRRLFLDYVREINSLRDEPQFYNTLTTNCTTSIWMHARVNKTAVPLSWKILASGHAPSYLYDNGRLDSSMPFEELRRRSHINEAARAADAAEDFSQRIRVGVPVPAPAVK